VYFCQKTYKSGKNNNCTADNPILNLNAPENDTRPAPTNYNDISTNGSNNSDDDPMNITNCIGDVKTMMDYTDSKDATENDENINYDEHGIVYWNYMGAFNVFNRLISTFSLSFEYLSTKMYLNDSSNNPEFLYSLVFAIKFAKFAELNHVSRQVQKDMVI
jgi:hypothetical protein